MEQLKENEFQSQKFEEKLWRIMGYQFLKGYRKKQEWNSQWQELHYKIQIPPNLWEIMLTESSR